MNLLELITKDLIEADVFTRDTTPEDLASILPNETLERFDSIEKSAARSAGPKGERMDPERNDIDLDGIADEVVEYITDLEDATLSLAKRLDEADEVAKAAKEAADALAAAAEPTPADDGDIFKNLDPEVAAIIKADRERLAKTEADLAEERGQRIHKEFVAKAAGFDEFVEDVDTFATTLQTIEEADPDAADAVVKALNSAATLVAAGEIFKELGGTGSGGGAWDKATVIAKSLIESGDYDSLDAARGEVWETNPELYDAYQDERATALRNR